MSEPGATSKEPLGASDRATLGVLAFFIAIAFTIELWWIVHHRELAQLSNTSTLAWLFSFYGDRAYYDRVTPLTVTLESFHVFFTQFLHLGLFRAILIRASYRHALQLAVSSYVLYSIALYSIVAHLSEPDMLRDRSLSTLLWFYGPNLPWILGNLFMAVCSARAIERRFRS